ncbi:siderophore-interacting protein [Aquamicrobium sp. NLF2-7]|uniref:siderophore-interacting protein n=1 Tax=Aquamicrobium sp. NLF2-7 TaxID=2918753 RepID=UPI001EFBFCC4|nr:siderophore-interacting protein [Aquamicrobium sp. NLF2-7]MCG8274456.1 siderophore-interacting protein [Aquamicrobium sp. NLF2-7]
MSETFGAQTFRATAVVTLDEMDHVLATLLDHLEEHATVIRSATGARLTSPFATVDIVRQPEAVHLDVTCGSAEILAMIKVFVAEHIFEFATGVPSIVWSGDGSADPFPPHFQKLVVAEAFDVTPRMRRVVFACETVASYGDDASYHVRLLLPPRGRVPVWPSLAADGRMVWPRGEDELVTRVYTIRSVDADRSRIAVDFVLHEGNHSPGAGFALNAAPGDVIGILGPGGDGCPDAPRLLLMGDEAALPAISRMVESLPPGCTADVVVEVEDEGEEQDIASQAQVRWTWLHRQGTPAAVSDLLENALAARLDDGGLADSFIWAGCEQRLAGRLRERLRARLPDRKGSHRIYGYWNAGSGRERDQTSPTASDES